MQEKVDQANWETMNVQKMNENEIRFVRYQFDDTEYQVPSRYELLRPCGIGAQGTVW